MKKPENDITLYEKEFYKGWNYWVVWDNSKGRFVSTDASFRSRIDTRHKVEMQARQAGWRQGRIQARRLKEALLALRDREKVLLERS